MYIPSNFFWVGLAHGEVLTPSDLSVHGDFRYCGVISPNPGGHSDEIMKHPKVADSPICAWCFPLPYRWYSYLQNVQATAPVGNSINQAGKPMPCLRGERHCPVRNEICFFNDKICQQLMLTGVAEGYGNICGGPFSPRLSQGALLTQILCDPRTKSVLCPA